MSKPNLRQIDVIALLRRNVSMNFLASFVFVIPNLKSWDFVRLPWVSVHYYLLNSNNAGALFKISNRWKRSGYVSKRQST